MNSDLNVVQTDLSQPRCDRVDLRVLIPFGYNCAYILYRNQAYQSNPFVLDQTDQEIAHNRRFTVLRFLLQGCGVFLLQIIKPLSKEVKAMTIECHASATSRLTSVDDMKQSPSTEKVEARHKN